MPKGAPLQKRKKTIVCAPKSKKLRLKLLDDTRRRAVRTMHTATEQEVGDMADKITRASKK
jgi:hypothetical protein